MERDQILNTLNSIFPFRKLDPALIELVADNLGTAYFDAGQVVFEQGAPAGTLFIVYGGEINLSRFEGQEKMEVGVLSAGDFFGLEMLEEKGRRRVTAVAQTSAMLLTFDFEHLEFLKKKLPFLEVSLRILHDSYQLSLRTRLAWRGPKEMVHFISRRHPIYLVLSLAPAALFSIFTVPFLLLWYFSSPDASMMTPLVLAGLVLLAAGLWTLWFGVDWTNDYSIVTSQRVVYQERVVMLYDSRLESPLSAILSVSSETSLIGRWLSYGDVIVRSYTGRIVLPKLNYPRQVAALIEADWFRARAQHTRSEKQSLEGIIRTRLGYGQPQAAAEAPAAARPDRSGTLYDLINNLFNLRTEKDGMIIYRTHWFMLLKRIWLPSAFLLGLLGLLVASVAQTFTLLTPLSALGLTVILGLLIAAWWIYVYIDWANDLYIITNEQIIDVNRKPLGHEERRAAPIKNILSIEFERLGLIGLLLNYGTVYIRVGDSQLTFDYVFNPSEVQQELFRRMAERDYREKQAELDSERQRMADWIEAYHRVRRSEGDAANPSPGEPISR